MLYIFQINDMTTDPCVFIIRKSREYFCMQERYNVNLKKSEEVSKVE